MATKPDFQDRIATILTRVGLTRSSYRVTPGLYGVGTPDQDSPVLVTANYKLSFDTLRFALDGIDAWILVADTRGINVWCAAGKGTFSSEEIINSVKETRLAERVTHHRLIVPQLGATGVSGLHVKKQSGFSVRFGPVRASDLRPYLQDNYQADESMRSVTFKLQERLVLIPVEFYLVWKPLAYICVAAFLLSGISPSLFSISAAWQRGLFAVAATLTGTLCGSVIVPIMLPWLPGRHFWLKGLWPALLAGILFVLLTLKQFSPYEQMALVFWMTAVSSFQAMNFTGCTPYTSPSGVEYEMRRGIGVQMTLAALGIVLWLVAPFIGS